MVSLHRVLITLASLVALTPGACAPSSSPCLQFGTVVTIADNHPNGSHVLEVSSEDVADGSERTYDIQGNNTGHGHTVTLTAGDFALLQEDFEVTLASSDTGAAGNDHTHDVTIACARE